MNLRHVFAIAVVVVAAAACDKKDPAPAKAPEPATKAAEPVKEPEKTPEPVKEPEKTPEPVKEPEKPSEPAKVMTPAESVAKLTELATLALTDTAKLAGLYADDAVIGISDAPENQHKGGAGAVTFYERLKTLYPDVKVAPQLLLGGEGRAVGVLLVTGTQTGEIPGMKPTGKPIGIVGAQYVQWGADGKITADWHFVDQTAILGQLGLLPPEVPFRARVEMGVAAPQTVLATGSQPEKDLVESHRKAQAALNAKDMKALTELDAGVADDIVFHHNGMPADLVGKEAYQKMFQAYLGANPDLRAEGDDIWAAGDFCVHASVMSGTNTGEMVMGDMKMPATNKKWTTHMLEISLFEGGKEKHFWLFSNGLATAKQLGLAPSDPPAAPKTP